jgi:hypothetical protein
MRYMLFAVVALVLASFLFADVGPAPPKPNIEVGFVKDGSPYSGPVTLIYHCNEADESSSPVGQREVTFSCNKGTCRNDEWFYKFNPCYYPKDGYFKYKIGEGEFKQSANKNFNESGTYSTTIDADKGDFTISSKSSCNTGLVLALVAAGALFVRR